MFLGVFMVKRGEGKEKNGRKDYSRHNKPIFSFTSFPLFPSAVFFFHPFRLHLNKKGKDSRASRRPIKKRNEGKTETHFPEFLHLVFSYLSLSYRPNKRKEKTR